MCVWLQGYRELLRVFCAWGGYGVGSQVCAGKVKGMALYLHAWSGAPNTLNRTLTEWALGTENVACDTDDSRCHWPLRQGAGAGGGPGRAALLEAAAVGVSNETGRAVLEAKSGGKTAANRLSVLDRDNLNDWATAARYCARLATDSPANCSRLSAARQLATDTLPRALHANGSSSQGVANLTRVACGLALYLMEGWAGANNSFMDRALSAYLNSLSLGHTFNESAMEDVGYLQWGSGAVTYALKAVRSTFNLQGALWTAAWPSCYRINGPLEFSAHAARAGYPGMTLSVWESKLLLRSLANDTDQGQALRRKLISSITTYRGDGINSLRGLLSPSQRAFTTHAVTPDFFADMDGSGFSVDRTMQPHYNISLVGTCHQGLTTSTTHSSAYIPTATYIHAHTPRERGAPHVPAHPAAVVVCLLPACLPTGAEPDVRQLGLGLLTAAVVVHRLRAAHQPGRRRGGWLVGGEGAASST